jgi:hypothetical protein
LRRRLTPVDRLSHAPDHAVLAVDSDIGDHGALDVTFGVGFSERRPLAALPVTLAQPLDAGAGGDYIAAAGLAVHDLRRP